MLQSSLPQLPSADHVTGVSKRQFVFCLHRVLLQCNTREPELNGIPLVWHGTVEESRTVEGECALLLCTSVIFSWKLMISFVNWFELYLMQRETNPHQNCLWVCLNSAPWQLSSLGTANNTTELWLGSLVPVNFGLDAFLEAWWAFFFFLISMDKGAPAAV